MKLEKLVKYLEAKCFEKVEIKFVKDNQQCILWRHRGTNEWFRETKEIKSE